MKAIHVAAAALVVVGILAGLRASAVLSRRRPGRSSGARARPIDSLAGALLGGLAAVLVVLAVRAVVPGRSDAEPALDAAGTGDAVGPDEAARRSTVRIVGRGCGGVAHGSGFVVRGGAVLTNAHVVAGLQDIEVWTGSGRRHEAALAVFDARRDLAVLRAVDLDVPGLQPSASPVVRGEAVSIYGYPGGGTEVTSVTSKVTQRNVVSGVDIYGRPGVEREVLFLSGDLAPGFSGGPVVDNAARYVGVAFAAGATPQTRGASFALADREVTAVLQAYAADPRAKVASTACVERRR